LVELAEEYDLMIMSDEIWSDILYEGRSHVATATIDDAWERTISLYGFSKTFALAGLQLGYIVATEDILEQVKKKFPGFFYPVNNLSMEAGRAAYEESWYWAEAFIKHLQKVRDYGYNRLVEIQGTKLNKPEATYVFFPEISSYKMTSKEMTDYLLKEARVAVTPGHSTEFSYFGPGGEGNIRMMFASSIGILEKVFNRVEKALSRLLRN
jgi:aspartate/methionine/tyrosine aminotransferase